MLDLTNQINAIGGQETEQPFRPVRCREQDITSKPPVNGFVYFTTDTKKIYCGYQNQYLLMGGTAGVYYGQRLFTEDELDTEETIFIFDVSEIEGDEIPKLDDLILNVPDGGFYRVRNVYGGEITAERIAIAGGTTGPVTPSANRPAINDLVRGDRYFTTANPSAMNLQFYCTTQSVENNYIDEIHYTIGTETFIMKGPYQFNETITVELDKYINKFSTTSQNTVAIVAYDAYGNHSQKKSFYFYLIELTLDSDFSAIYKVNATEQNALLNYYFTPNGGDTLETKFVELTLAPLDRPADILWSMQKEVVNLNTSYPVTINLKNIEGIEHGVYLLKACYYGLIPTTNTLLPSNDISSQIIYYDENVATPLIASSVKNTTIAQYSKYNMTYMIADNSVAIDNYADIYVNNQYSTERVELNTIQSWSYTFLDTGVFEIAIKYGQSELKKLGSIIVESYTGDIPVVDNSNAELYLTATGRTNSQANREAWEWTNASTGDKYTAKFEQFSWGNENGWIADAQGETALKLSNGAKLSIPNYHPFATEATTNGLTIELDFMFSGVLDYSKPLIKCLSDFTNGDGDYIVQTGFHITGQKATLNSSINKATTTALNGEEDESGKINETDMALQAFTQYFNEDTRIRLTYVIQRVPGWDSIKGEPFYFVYTYLNGVISGIMKLKVDTANKTAESFKDHDDAPSIIEIDSTFGDIYLYNIRVYRNELDMRTIINNYVASISNIDEKMSLFKDNNIFDKNGYISLNAIQNLSYVLNIPYVLFKGGCPMYEDTTIDDYCIKYSPDYRLPLTKKDYRLVSMQMYKPDPVTGVGKLDLDIPLELHPIDNEEETYTEFSQLAEGVTYQPTRGVRIYGQGTSSMVYPVKNLRVRPIAKNDRPIVYAGSCPVKIVCFKADFMDSSSSHNTNTGNLVYDLYSQLGLRTPPQEFKNKNKGDNVISYDIVTAIKGYPIICFYATGEENAQYTYIGRYNFNLDKATPEPFGFVPQFVYTGETVTDANGNLRKVVNVSGYKTENVAGKTVFPIDENGEEIKKDIIQCWEILNNDNNSPTKFLTPSEFNGDFDAALTTNHNWINYYEDRYPDAWKGAAEDGELTNEEFLEIENGMFRLARWINSTATAEATNAVLETPVFYQTLDSSYDDTKEYYTEQGEQVNIVATDTTTITTGGTNDENHITALQIITNSFISQVGQGHYDNYTFTYLGNKWYLNSNEVDIATYGISFNGIPLEGNSITVRYYKKTNWTKELYEKYTVDSAEYRLAKFQQEFPLYFDMDFSLFYYTLTLSLLMMDSRAKNMMLASWDQTKWYPIFYDMDTMLGVNNTGFNKFSFDTEDDPKDKVFNGFDSVLWNNFRTCFPDEIAQFYVRLRQDGGFNLSKLLETYNEKGADSWNESLNSADATYKYVRPFKEGYYDGAGKDLEWIAPGQISYLYAAQGKRSNHRAWWLSNRLNYLDSKYWPNTYGDDKPTQAKAFSFRAYALPEQKSNELAQACVSAVAPRHQFDLTALNNSYQSMMIGNIVYGPTYTVAGQTVTLGPVDVKHEVESYVLNPTLIADLGDLSNKYLGSFYFPGVATRLTRLKLGRSRFANKTAKDILENANYDVYYNSLLSALNIGESCPYLKEINIAGCKGLTSVDLTKCTRLQTLYADNTRLTDISFPANSILNEVYLPSTLTSLTLTNQPYLTTLSLDGCGSIQSIFLDNVPQCNTYDIVKSVFADNSTKRFYLTNINWEIADNSLEGDELKTIDILETLLSDKAKPRDGYEKAQCLSGTITINMNCKVDEFKIYNKYHRAFPNITIKYNEENVEVDSAVHIKFMDDLADNNPKVHYEVYASGDSEGDAAITLGVLISADGPNGVAMKPPVKVSDVESSYTFSGYWFDASGQIYYDPSIVEPYRDGALELSSIVPDADMTFYPDYTPTDRYYEVRFYNYDGIVIQQNEQDSYVVKYNDKYDGPIKNFHYRDSSALAEDKRWAFKGWTETKYNDGANLVSPTYIDVTNLTVTKNYNLYAHYVQENVREVATDMEYFSISYNNGQQIINLKDAYKDVLQGKITLPSEADGKPIVTVGDFKRAMKITHVFFLANNTSYTTIGSHAFPQCEGLTYVELPNNITKIDDHAFAHCSNLVTVKFNEKLKDIGSFAFSGDDRGNPEGATVTMMKLQIDTLPDSVETIYGHAFYHGGPGIRLTKLPKGLVTLNSNAFHTCENVCITELGSNDGSAKLKTLDNNALAHAGENCTDNVTVHIYASVKHIGEGAFTSYLNNKAQFTFYDTLDPDKLNIYYYRTAEENESLITSPDGSGTAPSGDAVKSMGCPAGSFTYCDAQQQLYVEVL